MEEQNDNSSEQKHGHSYWGFVLWPAALLLLYVLSFAPVNWLFGGGPPAVRTIYAPLLWTYKNVAPFRTVFDMYMGLWDRHW